LTVQAPAGAESTSRSTRAYASGSSLREALPRRRQGELVLGPRDPGAILQRQNETRVPELVPLRMARMLSSAFAYYRGSAAVMAADLAQNPHTGLRVASCGDAHIGNFGFYASAQRRLVFDLDDFDEAGWAPWEWDLRRLVTSVVLGGRDAGHPARTVREAALHAGASYRRAMHRLAARSPAQRYSTGLSAETISDSLDAGTRRIFASTVRRARRRTSAHFAAGAARQRSDGTWRFVDDPPVLTRLRGGDRSQVDHLVEQYAASLPGDVALLLDQYTFKDVAFRVVGVGSVGTRCYVALFACPDGDPLVLQIKEAQAGVLEEWEDQAVSPVEARLADAAHDGQRVVTYQRVLQSTSDPFLGFLRYEGRDFYVRQLRNMKGSIEPRTLTPARYRVYVGGCATVLARAHAQSPGAAAIAGYLGRSDRADRAFVEWSLAYAEQAEADYHQARADEPR
jgi:uncharacterized protein (DUF2252 family)